MLIPVLRSPAAADIAWLLGSPTILTPPEEVPSMACGIQLTQQPKPRGQTQAMYGYD